MAIFFQNQAYFYNLQKKMFKITCEMYKRPNWLTVKTIGFTNCQPCHFSDYKLLSDYSQYDLTTTTQVVASLSNNMTLDLNYESYRSLFMKINHVQDFSNYRFISLLDLDNDNHSYGIYSAVVRYLPLSEGEQFCTWWNKHLSWVHNFANCVTSTDDRKYVTIWELDALFPLINKQKSMSLPGIFQKAGLKDPIKAQYYAIDSYFLKFLLLNHSITKCEPFTTPNALSQTNSLIDTSEQIYQQYKETLPYLVGLKVLEIIDEQVRFCKTNKSNDLILVQDEIDRFILQSTAPHYNSINLKINMCTNLGGKLLASNTQIEYIQERCNFYVDGKGPLNNVGNNLYKLTCHNLNSTISLVQNEINDELKKFTLEVDHGY